MGQNTSRRGARCRFTNSSAAPAKRLFPKSSLSLSTKKRRSSAPPAAARTSSNAGPPSTPSPQKRAPENTGAPVIRGDPMKSDPHQEARQPGTNNRRSLELEEQI